MNKKFYDFLSKHAKRGKVEYKGLPIIPDTDPPETLYVLNKKEGFTYYTNKDGIPVVFFTPRKKKVEQKR